MMSATDTASSSPGHDPQFKATHWSVVVRAGDDDFEVRAAALEDSTALIGIRSIHSSAGVAAVATTKQRT